MHYLCDSFFCISRILVTEGRGYTCLKCQFTIFVVVAVFSFLIINLFCLQTCVVNLLNWDRG